MNELQKILLNYSQEWEWDFSMLSYNPNIDMDFIITNNNLNWDFNYVSENPNLTMKIVEKYPDKKWNWEKISKNKNIFINDIIEKYDKPWNFKSISLNPNITETFIEENIDKEWDWDVLMRHHNISLKFIKKYLHMTNNNIDTWKNISLNPNITQVFIEENIDYIQFYELSFQTLDIEFIIKHIDKEWCWYYISSDINLEIEDIINKYINLPWDIEGFIFNYNKIINDEIIELFKMLCMKKAINEEYLWEWLSGNDNIDENIIEKYIEKDWNWSLLSLNSKLSLNFIEKYSDKEWSWCGISEANPNINLDFVKSHLKDIYFGSLSINDFGYYKLHPIYGKVNEFNQCV